MSECMHLLWQWYTPTQEPFFFVRPHGQLWALFSPSFLELKASETSKSCLKMSEVTNRICSVRSKWIHTLLVTLWVTKNSCTRGTHCIVLSRRASSDTIWDDRKNKTGNVAATCKILTLLELLSVDSSTSYRISGKSAAAEMQKST